MNNNYYCIIMAGGVGSRFWPLSRARNPKQFLDILGVGKTLLQQTFDRFTELIPVQNIYIVSNAEYKDIILQQLPALPEENVLLEPSRRNTAPCIDYANFRIFKKNPKAQIIVAPSDHLILKEDIFLECVKQGLEFVGNKEALLTLGIQPGRPETGYGYIQAPQGPVRGFENLDVKKVKTFTEKPDLDLARVFYESGEFYWNAGIFFWSLPVIMDAFEKYVPEVHSLFSEGKEIYGTPGEKKFIEGTYERCRNISIDYAIMEKAENVFVLTSEFGWSDLGTWGSLYEQMQLDEQDNAVNGKKIFMYDSHRNVINVPDEKLVVLQGLDDYIVVESDDILLVCKKDEEQRIKEFVNDIRSELGDSYV
ncbi:MAG: mannose-1-phosphate guanylyltransferase [Bacteroidales bacterium]|nr:mannose-1-phosphate guanylyltransferase [Bacteroidales bacterium]